MANPPDLPSWTKKMATFSIFPDDRGMALHIISTIFVRSDRLPFPGVRHANRAGTGSTRNRIHTSRCRPHSLRCAGLGLAKGYARGQQPGEGRGADAGPHRRDPPTTPKIELESRPTAATGLETKYVNAD